MQNINKTLCLDELLDLPLREVIQKSQCLYLNVEGFNTGALFLNHKQILGLCSVQVVSSLEEFLTIQLQVISHMDVKEV